MAVVRHSERLQRGREVCVCPYVCAPTQWIPVACTRDIPVRRQSRGASCIQEVQYLQAQRGVDAPWDGCRARQLSFCSCVAPAPPLGWDLGVALEQHNTTQHNTTQHNTTQHNTTQHNTTQHNTTQHNTTQHNTTQHNTTQHNTTQHNTTQRTTTQHNTTQHNTTQHSTTQCNETQRNTTTHITTHRSTTHDSTTAVNRENRAPANNFESGHDHQITVLSKLQRA